MRIVVDFRNPSTGTVSVWNLVSFTYIVVSRNLNGAFSDIWATVAEIDNPSIVATGIDLLGSAYRTPAAGACSIYTDPDYTFSEGTCASTGVAATNTAAGGSG